MDWLKTHLETLKKSPLFWSLSADEIQEAITAAKGTYITCAKNSILFPANEVAKNIYIVLSGQLKVVHDGESVSESLVEQLHPLDCFGLAYCILEQPCYVSVKSTVKSQILALNYQRLTNLSSPKLSAVLSHNIQYLLAEKVTILAEKINYMYIKTLRAKLCSYLLNYHNRTGKYTFTIDINLTNLADYLGVSRPAMSRELGELQAMGLISYTARTFTLLDVEGLMEATIQ